MFLLLGRVRVVAETVDACRMTFELESTSYLFKVACLVETNLPDFNVRREASAAKESAARRHGRKIVIHLSGVHSAQHVALQVPNRDCGVPAARHYELGIARDADADHFGFMFLNYFYMSVFFLIS